MKLPRLSLRDLFWLVLVALSAALKTLLGVSQTNWEVRRNPFDWATMTGTLSLVSETPGKYEAALAQTGVSPPPITIWSPEEVEDLLAMEGDLVTMDGDSLRWG